MDKKDEAVPVQVFAGTQWETTMLKNLLEDAGIDAFLKDEYMGTIYPWFTNPGGVDPIKVFVSSKDLEEAHRFVEE